ncbi:MAG: MBL fold metallo-hydrolase [Roseburia sp.]|nr:MBL fold metallo-hydrolase [Roseburia sp.]
MDKTKYILKKTVSFLTLLFLLGTAGCQETAPLSEASATETAKTPVVVGGTEVPDADSSLNSPDAKAAGTNTDDSSRNLTVHYLDIGQGDATLITCGENAMLIDAGDNSVGTKVQSYLLNQNITKLDYVIGTHPDADHIGGLDVVITKFDCGTIFLTEEEKDTLTYEDVISAMEYKGYKKTLPLPGNTYDLGDASFTIVAPLQENNDSNDNSIALLLTYGDTRFFFEGDAGETEEEQILSSGARVKADVYKIGHHGSKTSTTDDMLKAVSPVCAVISAGENNRYGHPHAEVLNKLRFAGIKTFRTDEQGTVVAKSDGKNITFNMSPSDTWTAGEPGSVSDRETINEDNAKTGAVSEEVNTDTAKPDVITVHITDTGQKYHSASCRFLKDSDQGISLKEAKAAGYEPCKVCHPPQ